MNFASKKLSEYYSGSVSPADRGASDREKALLAENKKLRQRNKRLSTAMLYLVEQIEVRLPILNSRKNRKQNLPEEKPIPAPAIKRIKKNIIGKTWKPEKLEDTTSLRKKSTPLSMQQLFADKKHTRPVESEAPSMASLASPVTAEKETPPRVEEAQLEEQANGAAPHTPDLAPDEMSILASPTKDKSRELTQMTPSELFIKQEQKKTSSEEASKTYMAVSIASSPVPKEEVLLDDMDDPEDQIEQKLIQQNNMMREAMLRRVNRLRW